jgi:hypothetical protein
MFLFNQLTVEVKNCIAAVIRITARRVIAIGVFCLMAFVTAFRPDAVGAMPSGSKPEYRKAEGSLTHPCPLNVFASAVAHAEDYVRHLAVGSKPSLRPKSPENGNICEDRTKSPAAVSRKWEYLRSRAETLGDLADQRRQMGRWRPVSNA